MKKLLTVLALTLMTVVMAFTIAGCTNASAPTKEDFDALIDRVEELEEQNKNLNVFWTNKKEYSETETMTIYFRDTAVYKIRLNFTLSSGKPFWKGTTALNGEFYITGLCSDFYSSEIIGASFLEWNEGFLELNSTYTPSLIKKGVETSKAANYITSADYSGMTWLDFVICVPGTHVELARFKNVSFRLN